MKVIFKVIKAGSGNDIYFQRLSDALKKVNIDSVIEYYPKYFQYIPWALKLVNKKTPGDIIHSNVEYGWVFKEKGKPLYVTLHHNVFDKAYRQYTTFSQRIYHDFFIKPNTKKSLQNADKCIAVSNYTKKSFIETFGKYQIDVIYNFVDTDKFKPIKIEVIDKRFRLLFVGNLIKRKGADLLPKIMSQLDPKEFVLHYTTGLRTKIPETFDLQHMIPLGRLSEKELINEYNKCDMLLFPSRYEGFGYSIAEAMACGKPVLAFNNSSIPELLTDGINGFFCKTDDINEMVRKTNLIASMNKEVKKIGLNNVSKIKKYFSSDSFRKKVIYENY